MSEEPRYTATLKAGGGYDAPWLVVRADSEDELVEALNIERGGQALIEAANFLKAANNAAPVLAGAPEQPASGTPAAPAQSGGWGQKRSTPAPQGDVRFHPEGKQCSCGQTIVFKQTPPRKSDGKVFTLWTCPQQRTKGDGHHSEFVD